MLKNRDARLSGDGASLLLSLQAGGRVAEPSVYPDALSFSNHSRLYFHNAAMLSKVGRASDFEVFGVLYMLRHGLELWLKCVLSNALIDRFLTRPLGALVKHLTPEKPAQASLTFSVSGV